MKTLQLPVAFIGLKLSGSLNKRSNTEKEPPVTSSFRIGVHIFHVSSRFAICKTFDSKVKNDSQTIYTKQLLSGKLNLQAADLAEGISEETPERLSFAGQTLLIVNDDKMHGTINYGFMNARGIPDNFKVTN